MHVYINKINTMKEIKCIIVCLFFTMLIGLCTATCVIVASLVLFVAVKSAINFDNLWNKIKLSLKMYNKKKINDA